MKQQFPLPLDFATRPALGREDFFVCGSNALAVAMVDAWRTWPSRKLVLIGPESSGKTHLAHVWAKSSAAQIVSASDLADTDIPKLAAGSVCVENIDGIFGNAGAEAALFHLHNLVLAEGHSLMITVRFAPTQWRLGLPDLASRMQGTPVTQLDDPDDTLLMAILAKLFADRQIVPAPDVIPFLIKRMSRSFSEAGRLVSALDDASLTRPKGVTRKLASQVLEALQS